jgi:uncharacterized protein (UPF0335 family)
MEMKNDHGLKTKIISSIMNNAKNLGWEVKQTEKNVFILKKKKNKLFEFEQNTSILLDYLFIYRNND